MQNKTHRIFLVDDHQLILDGIKSLFSDDTNLEFVQMANDGLTALEWIESNPAALDLVIADVNMAGLSGIQLCEKIKRNFPHIKVLILSMHQNSAVIKEALVAEADGYIVKNTGKMEFSRAIYRIMDGGTYYSEAIWPLIYKEMQRETQKREAISLLSEREREVLELIVQELTSEEIAEKLFISKKTVDNHRQHLLTKTNSKSTVGLVKFAIKSGLEL